MHRCPKLGQANFGNSSSKMTILCCILHQIASLNKRPRMEDAVSTQNKLYSNVIHILQDNKVYSDGNSIRRVQQSHFRIRALCYESRATAAFSFRKRGDQRVLDQQNFSLGDKLSYQMRLDYKNEGSISSHFFWKKILILSLRNLSKNDIF